MTRNMLINAHGSEELRIAIVTDGNLERYEVAAEDANLYRGNIYRGIVANVQPSLGGAFVNIGVERDGLIRAEDVVPPAYHRKCDERRPHIEKILDKGQPLLVQVTRDGVGTKGSLLTTNLSIAGRYLVLMPFDEVRGVSRRAEEDELRAQVRERLDEMNLPEGCGVIARTNALDQPKAALNRDLNALLRLWKKVRDEAKTGKGPRLLYSDQDLLIQALRDFVDSSVDEVLVDDDATFEKARAYMSAFMPRAKTKLVRYTDRMPIFSHAQLEEQIDRIYQRKVDLPSGASIVIDPTEALTAIDVNSGRATKASSQEETAYKANMEAAVEVGRQLRLRDIGGLVVVDFIDMRSTKHQRNVEKALRDAMKDDKARFNVGRISPNGLLEINRQRMKTALKLRTHRSCPTCGGTGTIASPELVGQSLLRRIETRAVTGQLKGVRVALHPELADALQNGRRQELAEIEREFDITIEIIAATSLHRADEKVEWFQRDSGDKKVSSGAAVSAADIAAGMNQRPRQAPPAPTADDDATESTESAADETGGADETPKKSPRRRRRGGRRRKKITTTTEEEEAAPAKEADSNREEPADSPPPDADKPKKRPRRRRSAKSPPSSDATTDADADAPADSDRQAAAPRPRTAAPAQAPPQPESQDDADQPKKRSWWKRITGDPQGDPDD